MTTVQAPEQIVTLYRLPQQRNHVVRKSVAAVETVEEACEAARRDSESRDSFARYEWGDVQIVTHKFPHGYEAMVTHNPKNPRFTDEEIFARFADEVA